MHEEDHTLYLTVVDGRVHDIDEIENLTVAVVNGRPVRLKDFARVERGRSRSSTWSPRKASMPCCSTSAASPTAARSTSPTA